MNLLFACVIGVLYAAAFYFLMRRTLIKLIIGLIFLSHASNLLILTVGGLVRSGMPIIQDAGHQHVIASPDPLPQALILTAIVISFGVLAFALVLVLKTYQITGTDDPDQMRATDT